MQRLGFTVIKNATANVVRGGATAIVALTLPHFLTRALDHDRFAAWVLMLQIAAYAGYLDFGVQTAVARYLAQAIERKDDDQRDRLISTACSMLSGAGAIAVGVIALLIWQLPRIVHGIPLELLKELRLGVLVLGLVAAVMLPISVSTGVLIGLHRNEFTALAIGGSRILGAIAVLIAVHFTQSLVCFAICLGTFNLLGGFFQVFVVTRMLPLMRVRARYANKRLARELIRYCFSLAIYSFSMLFVSGLDISIVGYFNYSAVGYYAIAATLITFVAGLSNSVFAAMMTPVAVLQTRGELGRISHLVIRTTQLSSYASLAITLPVFVCGFAALNLWVGRVYAMQALPILEILLVAQAIRLIGNSYCTMLIATGQQRSGVAVALAEALANFVFSIVGAVCLGPIGVAWGTLIGALVGLFCLLSLCMRWAQGIPIPTWTFIREGILRPISVAMPILIYLTFENIQSPSVNKLATLMLAAFSSIFLAVVYGKLLPFKLRNKAISHFG